MKKLNLVYKSVISTILLATALTSLSYGASFTNFYGSETTLPKASDHSVKVARGYIIPTAHPIDGGARITVETFQDRLTDQLGANDLGVKYTLQAAINDGKGNVQVVDLMPLDKPISTHKDQYYAKQEFDLHYTELNKLILAQTAKAPNLVIGPGTALFVYAEFNGGHVWGSVSRGGIFFMPEDGKTSHTTQIDPSIKTRRPTELDLAYPISQSMANRYNDPKTGDGLKINGQIRSRVEAEGKFQIPLEELNRVKKEFFELANDPAKTKAVLGDGWTVKALLKYMKKDSAGNMILDAQGLPIPDPMVDTYYDNDHFDAAKKDMAIRYRWTEGNATGAWNFKPGMSSISPEGVVDRVEFGVDTTNDKPETIAKFSDSMDAINPFRHIRTVIPGAQPSQFLKPSVKVTDTRFKFELKNQNGLIIEVSLDDVAVASLRAHAPGTAQFAQVEMDIDHLAVKSNNVASNNLSNTLGIWGNHKNLSNLTSLDSGSFFDGRPSMHDLTDLAHDSPVKVAHKADFDLASKAIVALRDQILGSEWLPGAQKYAFAASTLDLVKADQASKSVRELLKKDEVMRKLDGSARKTLYSSSIAKCGAIFN